MLPRESVPRVCEQRRRTGILSQLLSAFVIVGTPVSRYEEQSESRPMRAESGIPLPTCESSLIRGRPIDARLVGHRECFNSIHILKISLTRSFGCIL